MLKHKNAKKALLDIIEELQKSQKDIEEKKSVFIGNIPDDQAIPATSIRNIRDIDKLWPSHNESIEIPNLL